jgi:hypothetical protein
MQTLQCKPDLLIDGAGNAQKGVLQTQIISPYSLMEALMKSVSALPRDVMLPFPLSKDTAYLVVRVSNLKVYVCNGVLAYVVHIPLNRTFKFGMDTTGKQ